jgi:hypothetical protein
VGANDRSAQELQNAEKNERGGSEYYQIFDWDMAIKILPFGIKKAT